jgi:NTP pyrophosphatase (non-canonical NTP hydrolase)
MIENLNDLKDKAFDSAKRHGFHNKPISDDTCKMLIITELAEAVEAYRRGKIMSRMTVTEDLEATKDENKYQRWYRDYVKDSLEDEVADTFIRLLDYAGMKGIDLHAFTPAPVQLIGDKTFPESCYAIIQWMCDYFWKSDEDMVCSILSEVIGLAKIFSIDLDLFVRMKMRYNESRPYLHGKKF